jgi:hypothetical protein
MENKDPQFKPDTMKKLKRHSILSAIIVAIGIVVMVVVGYTLDEPNLISPVLIVFGTGWFIITRVRIRSLRK